MKARSCLHSVTGWTEKGHRGQYSSPNESHDRVRRKKKEAKGLARTLKAEVAPFSSEEIGIKNSVWGRRLPWEDGWSDATTPGEEAERSFRTAVSVTRCIETVAETPGKSGKNFGQEDNRCLQAKLYRILQARKRENTLRRNPSKS